MRTRGAALLDDSVHKELTDALALVGRIDPQGLEVPCGELCAFTKGGSDEGVVLGE
jgi:hypothetical protein